MIPSHSRSSRPEIVGLTHEDWILRRVDLLPGKGDVVDLVDRLFEYRERTKEMHRSWTVEPGMITESGVAWAASDDIAKELGLE